MITRLFFYFGLFFILSPVAQAATLYIDPGVATLNRGDAIIAAVRVMPDSDAGECINVIDAIITYTENIQPVDISIGKSIFNIWVESPIINKENRTITFAGGIPNGYCGRVDGDPRLTNIIAEVIFRSPGFMIGSSEESVARIDFTDETQVLLNDGQGTRAPIRTLGATFTLEKGAGSGGIVDDWRNLVSEDNLPPESFSIELEKDLNGIYFGGKNFIIFSTTDKQTGISHYEVTEEPMLEFKQFAWGATGIPWIKAESPYVLKDQTLNSIVRVKAIDKAGNEYVATFAPEESIKTLSKNELYTYIFIGLTMAIVLVFVLVVVFVYRRKNKNIYSEKNMTESLEDVDDMVDIK